jgi:hypothetical protein
MRLAKVTLMRVEADLVHVCDDEHHNEVGNDYTDKDGRSYLVPVGDDERHNEISYGDTDKQ